MSRPIPRIPSPTLSAELNQSSSPETHQVFHFTSNPRAAPTPANWPGSELLSTFTWECTTRYTRTRTRCGTPQRRSHPIASQLLPRTLRPRVAPAPSTREAQSSVGSGAITDRWGPTARRDEGAGSRAALAGGADRRGGAVGRDPTAPHRPASCRRPSGGRGQFGGVVGRPLRERTALSAGDLLERG